MPRTPTNKIMRRRLRDEALAAQRKAEHPASTAERPASTTERPASAG
jgi:hypothetical protein